MIVANVDTSRLSRRLGEMHRQADAAALEVVRGGADLFVGFMAEHAPRDTVRYVRGWIEAGNSVGVGTKRNVPQLRESRWKLKVEQSLDRQIDRLVLQINKRAEILNAWYFSKGRPLDRWARKMQAEITRLSKALNRAVETKRKYLNAEGPVLAFDLFSNGRRVRTAAGKYRQLRQTMRQTTIRNQVYGGAGEIRLGADGPTVLLHNLEPHVTLVERKHRLILRAGAAVRRYTDARAKRVFMKELSRAG